MKLRTNKVYPVYPRRIQMRKPDGVAKGRVARNWPKRCPLVNTRPKGMINSRADCYKIALFQALLHVPQMFHYLGNVHKQCDLPANQCVMCATQALWQVYWNDERWPEDQTRLRNAETNIHAALRASVPADTTTGEAGGVQGLLLSGGHAESNAFLCYFLDLLRLQHDSRSISFDRMCGHGAQAQFTCDICKQNQIQQLPGTSLGGDGGHGIDLKIDQPMRNLSLDDYLNYRLTSSTDHLRCNSAACGGTYGDRDARIMLTSAPEVLTIKLQRLVPETDKETGEFRTKILQDDVDFDEWLYMSGHMVNGANVVYELKGVVAHDARDPNVGHYIAAVRAQSDDGKRTKSAFRTLDDDKAVRRHENFGRLQWPKSEEVRFYPTVLVYSRVS